MTFVVLHPTETKEDIYHDGIVEIDSCIDRCDVRINRNIDAIADIVIDDPYNIINNIEILFNQQYKTFKLTDRWNIEKIFPQLNPLLLVDIPFTDVFFTFSVNYEKVREFGHYRGFSFRCKYIRYSTEKYNKIIRNFHPKQTDYFDDDEKVLSLYKCNGYARIPWDSN